MSVQEKVQLPHVCASVDTPLASLLPYADTLQPWEAIAVLDAQARPVGIMMGAELQRLRANRSDPTLRLQRIMSTSFATVFPCMSLVDAARLRANNCFRGVIVVAEDETFLGVVSEPDLERARGPVDGDTASPP
jgi:CBS-domain-containing membrane protein